MKRIRLILSVSLLLMGGSAEGQILNTLTGFADPDSGWSGALGVGLSLSGGNVEERELTGAGRVQWQGALHRVRFLADGSRKSVSGSTVEERYSLHLRHNRRLTGILHTLVFAQVQQDRFQRLQERWLLGLGGRADVLRRPDRSLSVGAAEMLEIESVEGESGTQSRHRLSTYVSFETGSSENVSVSLTGFVQPLWEDFSDLRAVAEGSVRTAILGWLALVTAGKVAYDAEPPARVEKTDWSLESGLTVSF